MNCFVTKNNFLVLKCIYLLYIIFQSELKFIFQDGGFGANNPTAVAIHECKKLWPNQSIQCVVSLGMGRFVNTPTPEASTVSDKIEKLIKAATDTQGK